MNVISGGINLRNCSAELSLYDLDNNILREVFGNGQWLEYFVTPNLSSSHPST